MVVLICIREAPLAFRPLQLPCISTNPSQSFPSPSLNHCHPWELDDALLAAVVLDVGEAESDGGGPVVASLVRLVLVVAAPAASVAL